MDLLRYAIGFVSFHRRVFIAILLMVGLYFFLTLGIDYLPRFYGGPAAVDRSEENKLGGTADGAQAKEDGMMIPPATKLAGKQLLESGEPNELVDELLRLRSLLAKDPSSAVTLLYSRECLALSERLLEMETTNEIRRFALEVLADSLLMCGLVKCESGIEVESFESELVTKLQYLKDDSDAMLQGKAHLVMIAYKVIDLNLRPTEASLAQAQQSVVAGLEPESVFRSANLEMFCLLMLRIRRISANQQTETLALFDEIANRLIANQSVEAQQKGGELQQFLFFEKLALGSLADELVVGDPGDPEKIKSLFEGLTLYPGARVQLYQLALDCIRAEIVGNNFQRASELAKQLETTAIAKHPDDNGKKSIQTALDELKSMIK